MQMHLVTNQYVVDKYRIKQKKDVTFAYVFFFAFCSVQFELHEFLTPCSLQKRVRVSRSFPGFFGAF